MNKIQEVVNRSIVPLCVCALVFVAIYVVRIEQNRARKEQLARKEFESVVASPAPTHLSNDTEKPSTDIRQDEQGSEPSSESKNSNPTSAAASKSHRLGVVDAKVRLVFYCDYDNKLCRDRFQVIKKVFERYRDSACLTVRHYPASANGNVPLEAIARPEACQTALLVAAAAQLQREDVFWRLHDWLMQGEFNPDQLLVDATAVMGLEDAESLSQQMKEPSSLSRIVTDVVEARAKGVSSAPTVLLNGQRIGELDEAAICKTIDSLLEIPSKEGESEANRFASVADVSAGENFPIAIQQSAAMACVRVINPTDRAAGSGVVFAVHGTFVYALTAAHIVQNARSVEVQTFSRESFPLPAKTHSWSAVIASSQVADIAIVRFSTRESPPQPLAILPRTSLVQNTDFTCLSIGCNQVDSPPTCQAIQVQGARRLKRFASQADCLMWESLVPSIEGRSGGALITSDSFIIGLASGNSDGKGYYSHTDELYRLLSENGLLNLLRDSKQ